MNNIWLNWTVWQGPSNNCSDCSTCSIDINILGVRCRTFNCSECSLRSDCSRSYKNIAVRWSDCLVRTPEQRTRLFGFWWTLPYGRVRLQLTDVIISAQLESLGHPRSRLVDWTSNTEVTQEKDIVSIKTARMCHVTIIVSNFVS